MAIEFGGGIALGSVVLKGDAGHMLHHVLAYGIMGAGVYSAKKHMQDKTATTRQSPGEIKASILNGGLLALITLFIFGDAVRTFLNPEHISGGWVLIVALGGLIINYIGLYLTEVEHAGHKKITSVVRFIKWLWLALWKRDKHLDGNMRAFREHLKADTWSSLFALGAGLLMLINSAFYLIDPIFSVGLSIYLMFVAKKIIRSGMYDLKHNQK